MTLLDAPAFNEARDRRNRIILWSSVGTIAVLIIGFWLAAGRPVDFPWNWNTHLRGRMAINSFLTAVEKNDLPTAYSIWMHDPKWQEHPAQYSVYPFERFSKDWSPNSPDNEYGNIQSHRIAAARIYGNQLLTAVLINGRKSKPASLEYSPKDHKLNFAPEDVQLYLGP